MFIYETGVYYGYDIQLNSYTKHINAGQVFTNHVFLKVKSLHFKYTPNKPNVLKQCLKPKWFQLVYI